MGRKLKSKLALAVFGAGKAEAASGNRVVHDDNEQFVFVHHVTDPIAALEVGQIVLVTRRNTTVSANLGSAKRENKRFFGNFKRINSQPTVPASDMLALFGVVGSIVHIFKKVLRFRLASDIEIAGSGADNVRVCRFHRIRNVKPIEQKTGLNLNIVSHICSQFSSSPHFYSS
jgi:hypothetical protein